MGLETCKSGYTELDSSYHPKLMSEHFMLAQKAYDMYPERPGTRDYLSSERVETELPILRRNSI